MRPITRYLLIVLGASILTSCKEPLPTEISSLPEDRGMFLTSQGNGWVEYLLAWPKNTTTLFYCDDFGSLIAVVDVQTKTVRVVFNAGAGWVSSLSLSPDQKWLYFMVGASRFESPDVLHRVPITGPFFPQRIVRFRSRQYCISPDNIHVAYSVDDSLCIFDIEKQTQKAVSVKAFGDSSMTSVNPLLFSPDGKTILCNLYGGEVYNSRSKWYFLSLETESVQPCGGGPLFVQLLRWDDAGLRALCVAGFSRRSLNVTNISASTSTCIGQASGDWSDSHYAWSPDGNKVAFWDLRVLSWEGLRVGKFECCLRVINITAGRTDLIAVGITSHQAEDETPGPIAFSGDGKLVAYAFGNRIYMKAVP